MLGLVSRSFAASIAGLPTSLALAVAAGVSALPFARLDLDAHHDGVMVAAAVAVRDGAVIHRDVFAQYGPVTPLLQSTALHLFDNAVLGIRLVNVLAIAATVFAMADLGRVAPRSWPVSLAAGRWAAISWIAVADFFLWVPQYPWSSMIATAMLCLALLFVARALSAFESNREHGWRFPATMSAVLLAMMPLTRINVGVLTTVATVILGGLTFWCVREGRPLLVFGGAAWAVAWGLVLLAMAGFGALGPWWHQSILWPLQWAHRVGTQLGPDALLHEVFIVFWPALIGIGVIVALSRQAVGRWRVALNVLSTLIAVGLLLALFRNPDLPRLYLADQVAGRTSFVDSLTRGSLTLLTLLVAVALLVSMIISIRSIGDLTHRDADRLEALGWLLLVGFGLAGLSQYAPVPDSRHIWWGLPVALLLVTASFGRRRLWTPMRNPLVLVFLAAAVAAPLAAIEYLAVPRVSAPEGTVAAGMLLRPGDSERLIDAFALLERTVGRNSAVFLVADGTWSVFDGQFHADDARFVDWGAPLDLPERLAEANLAVVDSGDVEATSAARAVGLKQLAEAGGLIVMGR